MVLCSMEPAHFRAPLLAVPGRLCVSNSLKMNAAVNHSTGRQRDLLLRQGSLASLHLDEVPSYSFYIPLELGEGKQNCLSVPCSAAPVVLDLP